MEKPRLVAHEGMVYTDGIDVYGEIISVGVGRSVEEFYQITKEEAEKRMKEAESNGDS